MPTEADVVALEAALPAFLQTNSQVKTEQIGEQLSAYRRQYLGLERAGKRLVFANFFCNAKGADWKETAVVVDDGGDCYFQATYNVDTDRFISLRVNGES